jgi:N-acetylmuramoyl-L-alanine amidase
MNHVSDDTRKRTKVRSVNKIILHYLGPGSGAAFTTAKSAVKAVTQWHMAQGWSDIGYHWVVTQNGDVAKGRPEETVGAHAYGANTGSIGILCCIGVEDKSVPEKMLEACSKVVADVAERFGVPLDRAHVIGHKDVPGEGGATACPGQLYPLIPEIISKARHTSQPTVTLDGKDLGEALLVDGQSYLPVRRLAEAMGLKVKWDAKTKRVELETQKKND